MKKIRISKTQWIMALMLTAMVLVQAGCSCGKKNQNSGNNAQGTSAQETTQMPSTHETSTQGTSAHETSTHETSTEEIGTSSTDGVNQMTQPEHGTSADAVAGGTSDPIYVPGTYTGSAKGYGGNIEVTVEVDENHILSVKAVGDKETENVGQKAIKELEGRIIEANDTNIEGVSGATYSSQGLFEAVNDALAQAYTGE